MWKIVAVAAALTEPARELFSVPVPTPVVVILGLVAVFARVMGWPDLMRRLAEGDRAPAD